MLITNIRLFDGTTDNLIEDSSIWVEDNLIRYAGPSKKLKDVPDMRGLGFDVWFEKSGIGLRLHACDVGKL